MIVPLRRVPEFLSKLPHVKKLRLEFTDEVELPEWFYNLQIDELTIAGEMSKELQDSIKKHFPKVVFSLSPPKRHMDLEPKNGNDDRDRLHIHTNENAKPSEAYYKIIGVVRDEKGPLKAATVCEIDEKGRIVEAVITDANGNFTMKFRNKKDKVRISYVGYDIKILKFQKKKYDVLMKAQSIWL